MSSQALRTFRVVSWNVNGIRATLKVENAFDFIKTEDPDVVFLSEVKVDDAIISSINFPTFVKEKYPYFLWNCCQSKKGYSGLLMMSKERPVSFSKSINLSEADNEGRVITAEFKHFNLVNCYVPNAGQKLERLAWRTGVFEDKMTSYLKALAESKPVFYSGDLNVAFAEIDIHDSKKNQKSAGHTPQERAAFKILMESGFTDVWRCQNPGVVAYTYWGARSGGKAGGKGWRLDYFMAGGKGSAEMCGLVRILDMVEGSDHVPVAMDILIPNDDDDNEQTENPDTDLNSVSNKSDKNIKSFFLPTKKRQRADGEDKDLNEDNEATTKRRKYD